MMLSANPFHQHNLHAPSRPSPLAERPANVLPRACFFPMASQPQSSKQVVPQRTHKPNPVIQSRDAATQRRRDMFFRRVQKDRDDRKWESRGEQIQRLDFVSDQKRWEAEKARQAPELKDDSIEQILADDLPEASTTSYSRNNTMQPDREVTEAELILLQEEYELQALVAAMEEEQENQDTASQHYGSDDDDYDQIFREYTPDVHCQPSTSTQSGLSDPDAMDMTDG